MDDSQLPSCHPERSEGSGCLPAVTIPVVRNSTEIPSFARDHSSAIGNRQLSSLQNRVIAIADQLTAHQFGIFDVRVRSYLHVDELVGRRIG